MKYLTINETAERLSIPKERVAGWFYRKENPLEVITGSKINKVNGKRLIPEPVVDAYKQFMQSHVNGRQIANMLGVDKKIVEGWINRKKFKQMIKVSKAYYVPLEEVLPLKNQRFDKTNCLTPPEIANELHVDHTVAYDYIEKGLFDNTFRIGINRYVPRESVEKFKKKYCTIDNIEDYFTLRETAKILGLTRNSMKNLAYKKRIDLNFVRHGYTQEYYFSKTDVYEYKSFLDSIPTDYYTVEQLGEKLNLSPQTVVKKVCPHLQGIRFVKLDSRNLQRVIPKESVQEYIQSADPFELLKPEEPTDIFELTIANIDVPIHASKTAEFFREFFDERQRTTRASKNVQQMTARYYGFLYNEFIPLLKKDIFDYNDLEIQTLLKRLTTSNSKKLFVAFLDYCQHHLEECRFTHIYKTIGKDKKQDRLKDIYPLEEFLYCERYVKDIECHLPEAITDRKYAITWLYVALHLINAWRSSDFMNLPPVRIDLIGVESLDWFQKGHRLTLSQAQLVVNQYATKRFRVSKTGAMNRFLVNLDMLIPIATMIVICELHRQKDDDYRLMSLGTQKNEVHRNQLKKFFNGTPIEFGSRKMNRTFMTYLFHKATNSVESAGVSLELVQYTRAHKEKDSTTLYIQSTNQDGLIDNVSLQLCNRGHFGYLYNLLIETMLEKIKQGTTNTITQRTQNIQELRKKFVTPYSLDTFGTFLQSQQEERESLAIRIAKMPPEELKIKLLSIHKDKMPAHTEHAQCFTYPNCDRPNADSCVGCPNMVPKNYLLISLKEELDKRIRILKRANYPAVANRERAWIMKLLVLLQEAVDAFGKQYVEAFIQMTPLLENITNAFAHFEKLKTLR